MNAIQDAAEAIGSPYRTTRMQLVHVVVHALAARDWETAHYAYLHLTQLKSTRRQKAMYKQYALSIAALRPADESRPGRVSRPRAVKGGVQ